MFSDLQNIQIVAVSSQMFAYMPNKSMQKVNSGDSWQM